MTLKIDWRGWSLNPRSPYDVLRAERILLDTPLNRLDFPPVTRLLSKKLEKLRDDLTAEILAHNSGWQEILAIPEQVPDEDLAAESRGNVLRSS